MTHLPRLLLAALLTFSAGCAATHAGDDEGTADRAQGAATSNPTITFNADWSVAVSGALHQGSKVDVVYDPARLTTCRGTQAGIDQWSISVVWKLGDLTGSGTVAGLMGTPDHRVTIDLPQSGDLQIWFTNNNRWGCNAYDSAYGANYHFNVGLPENAPGWMGNAAVVLSRATCDGSACDGDRKPLDGWTFDTWTRQRAAITSGFFDVWKEGVTDWDNPDLWKQLDARVVYRLGSAADAWQYVSFDHRVNHDARYRLDLRAIDPLKNAPASKAECPAGLVDRGDGYVSLSFDFYFVVNGVQLRPAPSTPYHGTFVDYRGPWAVCFGGA